MAADCIELRGVRVHNLKGIDVDIPLQKLTVIVGVSGSGKSSLAFDTLYAEGQRRYIDSFSAYARQFLDRLQRPDADRIDRIPPAIAIRQSASGGVKSGRSTVATETEVYDYLRLLYSKVGKVHCDGCGTIVTKDTTQSVLDAIHQLPDGTRFQLGFPLAPIKLEPEDAAADKKVGEEQTFETVSIPQQIDDLKEDGFTRAIINGTSTQLGNYSSKPDDQILAVIVDRLTAGQSGDERISDSLETAFRSGNGQAILIAQADKATDNQTGTVQEIDGKDWLVREFNDRLVCSTCSREFVEPEHRLFSFNSPLGACPQCSGTGQSETITFERVVPDPGKSLIDGAIAPWTTPAYRHELDELLLLADDYDLPVDIPFSELADRHRKLIYNGVPERDFGGLKGFFKWLQRNRYKVGVGVYLSRWRTYVHCDACEGSRLNEAARAVRIGGKHIGEFARHRISEALSQLDECTSQLDSADATIAATVIEDITARLQYLNDVGLGYISLDRRMHTLSGGERQRVALTAALGSSLVNTLYVLDEPSAGLHPSDSERILQAIERLRTTGNTIVVVEHEEAFFGRADHVVEIGPAAGRSGGQIVFKGCPDEMLKSADSVTGNWITSRSKTVDKKHELQRDPSGFLKLSGVNHHNLKNIAAEIPLGVLCVITGVSGSGKSSLIHETLFPAVCSAVGSSHAIESPGKYKSLEGCQQIAGAVMVDQKPVGRSSRSNPVTYLKAFDDIRKIFALTAESKLRNFTPSTFSFNSKNGGRCPKCEGSGQITIDMQFLADLSMVCPECNGHRYRAEVLEAKYRGLSISDVLNMTVDEAFTYFRGHARLQKKLQVLRDVGLGYVPLGQPATTLSGGESQRLKIAAYMSGVASIETADKSNSRGALFLLDEPTNGLHGLDVQTLLKSLDALVSIGHSLIVIEHHLDVIRHADYIIDLGPGAGDDGGRIVASGTPAEVAATPASVTGQILSALI